MAKQTQYANLQDWVSAEYSVTQRDGSGLSDLTLSKVGQVLRHVHPQSPAGLLGLQPGDILHALNGGIFDEEDLKKTFQPRRFGRAYSFDFFRPSTRQKLKVKGRSFPFGAKYGQTVDSFRVSLRNGDPDPHDIDGFWADGTAEDLAALWPAFEAYNLRLLQLNGAPFSGPFPQSVSATAPLAHESVIWPGNFAWLAICAANAGQWGRAQRVLETVEDHFETSGDSGMMSMFAAMAHTRAMLAENRGDIEKAVSHIEHAIEMSPQTAVLHKHLARLTGQAYTVPASAFIGKTLSYDLERHDPAGRFAQAGGQVSLQESVSNLLPGEVILVCLMSRYRTNGPYVEGFRRAHIPLARLSPIFKEVHIVTVWDQTTSRDLLHYPIMEPALEKSGVAVSVLFDEADSISGQLQTISAPTNLIIDHTGTIIADGWLGDDKILWEGLGSN